MKPVLLKAQALRVEIGRTVAVQDLDLSVEAGQCVAVLGCNGVGKSTLLAALAGLQPVAAGGLQCAGRALTDWSLTELAQKRAWLPQHPDDPFAASVLDAVLVGRHPWLGRFDWEGEEDLRIARTALAQLGLAGFEARNVQTLSGGERQRVALAALLAQEAPLYLLDEPLLHLDLASQMLVLARFRALAQAGAAVVMVIHDINLALRWADQLLLLEGQGQWRHGPTAELATAQILGATLGHPLREVGDEALRLFVPV